MKKLKKLLKEEYEVYNLFVFDLKNVDENNKFIIIGGDGTIHYLINYLKENNIKNEIYFYKGGTGNDFCREFKEELININKLLDNLPMVEYNNEKHYYINGVGFGVDGLICHLVNNVNKKKNSFNYFKSTLKSFITFKRYKLEVEIDNKKYSFKRVLFSTVTNGKYFGGGMNLSPKSNRFDNDLEFVIVYNIPLIILFLCFPLIYFGIHKYFLPKRWFKIIKGRNFYLKSDRPLFLQEDGEVTRNIDTIKISI